MGSAISYLNELDVKATTYEMRVQIACAEAIVEAIREGAGWPDLYRDEQDRREKAEAERDAALAAEARARGEAERMAAALMEARWLIAQGRGWEKDSRQDKWEKRRTAWLSRWVPAAPAPPADETACQLHCPPEWTGHWKDWHTEDHNCKTKGRKPAAPSPKEEKP